ncbi:MAG: TIGR01777 family oxidoreductase [Desulfobacterales bacterium]
MRIFITGASGFVGSRLTRHMLDCGHQVTGVARHAPPQGIDEVGFSFVTADTTRPGSWQTEVAQADAVINLAGRSIFGRWTDALKQEIRDSRILTTRHLVGGMQTGKPVVFISASGVGYYGDRGEEPITEDTPAGSGFLAQLSLDWEAEARRAAEIGARVVFVRLGVVLGPGGGALSQMIPAFKAFVGGPIGSGRQWFPWIHLEDLAAAVAFILDHTELSGPVNLCAPHPVRNRELAQALGGALGRPAALPAPAFMLKLILGEFAGVLLDSQRALPQKLTASGFRFRYRKIQPALAAVLRDGGNK